MFTVIRCRDLQRSTGKTDDINAYAKVGYKLFYDFAYRGRGILKSFFVLLVIANGNANDALKYFCIFPLWLVVTFDGL